MGYNIEVSFNALKQNISETRDLIISIAVENGCNYYYNDFEFENNLCYNRNHCVITLNFQNYNCNIDYIVKFLKIIRNIKGIYVESIYDNDTNNILFASKFYITQMMDKHIAKIYNLNKRLRSYSEDETLIMNIMQKHNQTQKPIQPTQPPTQKLKCST
jgi:hypothetical protein